MKSGQHLLPLKLTPVYDAYWRFAAERQNIFFNRIRRSKGPWTNDPILRDFKFTNAYRASDRVSQYLIRNVIYREDLPSSVVEVFFRIILFKLFNKIETWEALERKFNKITYEDFELEQYGDFLSGLMERRVVIYSGAYIMHPGSSAFGQKKKHQNHLRLLELMMQEEVPQRISDTTKMRQGYKILLGYPTIGNFLAYQFITDINYSTLTDYSETEFVVPGPGALDGISKCFSSLGGLSEAGVIRLMVDIQELEFERLGIVFQNLWGRGLQLIDCQNLFCEISKYSRVSHPEIQGVAGRTRIKQKFSANFDPISYRYPPKWGVELPP